MIFLNFIYFNITIGYSQSKKKNADGKLMQFLITNRFAVPLLALGTFTAYNYYIDGVKPVTFNLVTKQQFLGIIAGFLSNRIALLLTEIKDEIRLEDFLSIVPGSFAEVYRESRKLDEIRERKIRDNENRKLQNGDSDESEYDEFGELINERTLSTVVVICGPQAAGRMSLSNSLLKNGKCNTKIRSCKFLTTDRAASSLYPDKYIFTSEDAINNLKSQKKIVYEGEEKSFFGSEFSYFLSLDDLTKGENHPPKVQEPDVLINEKKGVQIFGQTFFGDDNRKVLSKVPMVLPCVIDGPPEMIEALMKYVLVFVLVFVFAYSYLCPPFPLLLFPSPLLFFHSPFLLFRKFDY